MSSLTAMTILPQLDCRVAAPCSPRRLGARRVLGVLQEDHRPQVGQHSTCITTRRMPLIDQPVAQVVEEQRLVGTFLITLDSLGVTWLMIEGEVRRACA